MKLERLQAPSGGINMDASPESLSATQAADLVNLLPGVPGKVFMRGPIRSSLQGITTNIQRPDAFWAFDDFALFKGDTGGGVKTWRCDIAAATKTDVTATLVEVPLDYRHARFWQYVYGAIVDAASPQLGRWDGAASAIVPMANAPFRWTDLQVYMNRLFVLGGSVPGTTTPANAKTLYWSDSGSSTVDLSLLASWQDDVSGLTNQIAVDMDDTPIGLAGCGKYMAIIGSRSINVLSGSGSSSFSVRNLTKNWGCTDIKTIVEVDDGFYFMSDRGFAFCDGSTVSVVSDGVTQALLNEGSYSVASFNHGYIALASADVFGYNCWLFHAPTRAWSRMSLAGGVFASILGVFRTNTYPLVWSGGGPARAESVTSGNINGTSDYGYDYDGSAYHTTEASWVSRHARLGSPSVLASVKRLHLDYRFLVGDTTLTTAKFLATVYDSRGGSSIGAASAAVSSAGSVRQRVSADIFGESDSVRLSIASSALTGVPPTAFTTVELYDAWIEYDSAQERGSY